MTFSHLVWLAVAFPLAGFLVNGALALGRPQAKGLVSVVGAGTLIAAFGVALGVFLELLRQRAVHQEAREREGDGEPHQMGDGHHPCRRLMFWRSTDCLWRKMARMIASPTAASAAATVMTKKTMMYPLAP